jgi:hypothetical protein
MRNTLLHPPEPLGDEMHSNQLCSEISDGSTNHPAVNSVTAPGGTLSLVPMNRSSRANNGVESGSMPTITAVATSSSISRNVQQHTNHYIPSDSNGRHFGGIGDITKLLEAMNKNTKSLMQSSICEVQSNYQQAKANLKRAQAEKDGDDIIFHKMACCNLMDELRQQGSA